jgi:zinc protease
MSPRAGARVRPRRPAAPTAPRRGSRPAAHFAIERFELACGARLLVSPRPGAPVTAIQVHLRGGHSLDPAGREGTAFLTGSLLDQGTRTHTEEQIATELETAGGSLTGDASGLSGTIASGEWRTLAELACELLTEPTFPQDRVQLQRKRLLDRLLLESSDPRARAERLFQRLVYGRHFLGRAPQGTASSVAQLARRDLVAFHRSNWVGCRALIAVCGDVEPRAVARAMDRRLAGWKRGVALPPREHHFPPRTVRVDAFEARREQVHLYVGHLGVPRMHPDYPALVVMDHVLGTGPGFTNRISRRLRDELGLAYTVHAAIHSSAGIHPGMFLAYIGTSPEHAATALGGFRSEIRRIQEQPVAEDELATAIDYVVGSYALSFQRAARRANYMISVERHGLPDDNLELLPRQIAAVTADQVQRAAREHLFPSHSVVASGGPLSARALRRIVAGLPA